MIELRHIGIYVKNLALEQNFYQVVFHMKVIVSQEETRDVLMQEILESLDGTAKISKLITERGKQIGSGDMIELIEVICPKVAPVCRAGTSPICTIAPAGTAHICLGIDDMAGTLSAPCAHGGDVLIEPVTFPTGRACAFCADPEGNVLELIA